MIWKMREFDDKFASESVQDKQYNISKRPLAKQVHAHRGKTEN